MAVAATAISVGALVVAGGAVRVSESGVGCPDWPLCDGRIVPHGQKEAIVEYTHRVIAVVAIALLAMVTVWAFRRYRRRPDVGVPLAAALVLVPVQALLGAVVVWLEVPDRLVGVHFMVGMVMLALCTHACVAAWRGRRPVTRTYTRVAVAAGAVGLILVALGASVVATDALHACGEQWPACNGGFASGGGTAVLQVAHRSTAYLLVGITIVLLVLGLRGQAPLLTAALPATVAVAQIGVGIGLVLSTHGSLQHDVFRVAHVAGAAALWASVVAALSVAVTVGGPLERLGVVRRLTHAAAADAVDRLGGLVTRRSAVAAACALVAATALPFVLALVLIPARGGSGVVTGTIWVANESSDSVTGIDADTHAVVTVIRGVAGPHNVEVAPGGRAVWVTSPPGDRVSVIDTDTLSVRATVRTGESPAHVVLTPDGRRALITNSGDNTVALVDGIDPRLVGVVATGAHPHGLRPSPDGRSALLANLGASTLTLIDLRKRAAVAIIVGRAPVQVAWGPDGRFAYATVNAEDAVVKVDTRTRRVVGRATVGRGPVQLAVTPDGQTLVVASQGTAAQPDDTVSIVGTRTMLVEAVLATGAGAHGIAVEPGGRQAFVTDVWAGDVAVIDLVTRSVVDRIHVGGEPNGIGFSPLAQPHARAAANMGSARTVVLPLGGRTDGGGTQDSHAHPD